MRRLFGILGLVLVLGFSTQWQPVEAQASEAFEIIRLVNEFRATKGLPPLTTNNQLMSAAQQQAEYIGATNRYTHTGTGGSTPQTRANAFGYSGRVSENIVGGSDMTPPQGLAWWINSPVHYNTLVTDYYTEIGGGYSTGTQGQRIYAIVVGNPGGTTGGSTRPATTNAAPIAAPRFNLASPNEDGSIVHIVQSGQAMWTLGAYYQVELDYIYRINNLAPNAFINAGDEIIVQLADGVPTPTPLPTPTPPFEHIVQRGQTYWTIAALHGLKVEELLYLNSLTENSFINPGDELTVRLRPGQSPPPTATPQMTHTIRRGQGLWEIAIAYGLTLDEILSLNNLTESSLLQPGQELLIREPIVETQAEAVEAVEVVENVGDDEGVVSAENTLTPTQTPTSITPPTVESTLTVAIANVPPTPELPPTPTASAAQLIQPTSRIRPDLQAMILIGSGVTLLGALGLAVVLRR